MPSLSTRHRIGILVTLAIMACLPALRLPFIAEDYTQIPLARHFAEQGWTPLFHEVNLGPRATYMFMSALLDRTFGFTPLPFYAVSLFLHALCVLLVYSTGVWTELGESAAFWAAAFFAVQEGHQEAVMSASSGMYPLVFLFGMAAWVCWVKWLQGASWKWYTTAIAAFLLAAASNESVCAIAVLILLPVIFERRHWRRGLTGATPFLLIAAAYMIWLMTGRIATPGYNDIRFSLSAPWLHVLLNSWWRLLFVWGLVALAVLLWVGKRSDRRLVIAASLWMIVALLPYSFLTYMLQVPSRHTYLASAGLAWLFGAAASRLYEQRKQTALVVLCIAALAVNLEILWVKKLSQFQERARPTELLKQAAAASDGSVTVNCFPLADFVAQAVLDSVGTRAAFNHSATPQDANCFSVQYRNRQGQVIHESRRLGTERHGTFY
jgi:hypothetical protein